MAILRAGMNEPLLCKVAVYSNKYSFIHNLFLFRGGFMSYERYFVRVMLIVG